MSSRGSFSGQLGFIFAAAGSAIGLSNIWRFPYLTGENGGAVFVAIYIVCIVFFGLPIMIGEIAIGRAARKDAYGSYKRLGNERWGLVGLMGIVTGIFILSYYNVVSGWAFGYMLEITLSDLLDAQSFSGYFTEFVSAVGPVALYTFTFTALTAACIIGGVQKGVERASKFMMPALFLILIGLVIYSLTLPGAEEGIRFFLIPDFSEINQQTIFEALKFSFFKLSIGVGGLITYGSYMQKDQNIVQSSSIVATADFIVALLAGLMVFPLVFTAGQSPSEGPPLVFMVMPSIFQSMGPALGKILGGLFFLLICFAAITSCFSLLELITAYFVDEKKMKRSTVVIGVSILVFLLGLPSMLSFGAVSSLSTMAFYKNREFLTLVADVTDISLTTGGCLMCIFINKKWKLANLDQELTSGYSTFPQSIARKYLNFCIRYLCPYLLGALTVLMIIDKLFGLF